MRVAFGVVGLALAVVAIGACGDEHYKGDDAVSCMAYLTLQRAAVAEGRSAGDLASLDVAKYFASSFAVFDDVEAGQLQLLSWSCEAQAPIPTA